MRGSRSVPAIRRAREMIRGCRLSSSGSARVFGGSRPVIGSVNVAFNARSGSLVTIERVARQPLPLAVQIEAGEVNAGEPNTKRVDARRHALVRRDRRRLENVAIVA